MQNNHTDKRVLEVDKIERRNDTGKRVLVVEDEPVIGRVCKKLLADDGFSVDVAASGNIAQDMLNKQVFNLCIFDIRTPGINGMDLYRYLQKEQPELSMNVIFMSGDALSRNVAAFLVETKRPFLAKPFTINDLRTTVQKVISRQQHCRN